MTDLKRKVYQMFILGTEGDGYKTALGAGLGGMIFFTKDIQTPVQFRALIESVKNIAKYPLFLSIDQEGGRVERTENIHGGKKYLSARFVYQKGLDFLKKQTEDIAQELVSYGINLNFAPCIDTNTNPDNPIIGERSFSDNPDDVIEAEKIVSAVYKNNGIIPCVKHFPGHGDADKDSHLTLPEINLSLSDMEKFHIKPFKSAVENGIDMIMVAHLRCKCFDDDIIPSSLSKNVISYLRDNLNFQGVIISDDMVMKGVENFGEVQAVIMALKAGVNMFIYRHSKKNVLNIIEKVYHEAIIDKELAENINNSYEKIIKLKKKYLNN